MTNKSKTKVKKLTGEVLGVQPFLTRNNVPGVRVFYRNKAFVLKNKTMDLVETVTAASVTVCDADVLHTRDLALAIRTLVGVQDAWDAVVSYLLPQLAAGQLPQMPQAEPHARKGRKNAKRK